jgi:ADP-ribose pyrophosphatase YjhB (NUDIX family)
MPRYSSEKGLFSFSVKGLMIRNGRVLLVKADIDDFWTLPGGTTEFLEPSEVAVRREFMEEAGFSVKPVRPLWLVENFFGYDGERNHCIELCYLVEPEGGENIWEKESFSGVEHHYLPEKYGSFGLEFRWFTIEELHALNIKPVFLKDALMNVPQTLAHVLASDLQ